MTISHRYTCPMFASKDEIVDWACDCWVGDGMNPALVDTDAAKALLTRPVFPGIGTRPRPLGGHIAANAYDLRTVEVEAYRAGYAAGSLAPRPSKAAPAIAEEAPSCE